MGIVEIADALAQDLDVVVVLQEPADRGALDGPGLGELRQMPPGRDWLRAVFPTDDDQRAVSLHRCSALIRNSRIITGVAARAVILRLRPAK
jgi:hypothetical protein